MNKLTKEDIFKRAKNRLGVEEARLEMVKKVAEKSVDDQRKRVYAASRAVQEYCEHKNVKETDDHDYHNNCHWTDQNCVDCGKYLGKY